MARDLAHYDDVEFANPATAPAVKAPVGPSLWTRFAQMIATSRRRKAENAVETYIRNNGGRLTDNLERDISRKFGRMAGDGL